MTWVRDVKWILAGGLLLVFGAIAALSLSSPLPSRADHATIIAIYPEAHRLRANPLVRVVARADDGRSGEVTVPLNELKCRVGQRIRATTRGVSLYPDAADCASFAGYDGVDLR